MITAAWLRDKRRYAIVMVFVIGAVLTPPDVWSQIAFAAEALLFYELIILVLAEAERHP